MKKILMLFAFIFIELNLYSQTLDFSDVNLQSLKELLTDSFKEASEIDEDGDLFIKDSYIKVYVYVDEKRKMLEFRTSWEVNKDVSENRLCRVINNWNKDKIFMTAYAGKEYAGLKYFLYIGGGINSENFNSSLEWIFSLSKKFEDMLEDEDVF